MTEKTTLTVGSVCSGIGAPETAWAPLGWDFLWTAEIEPFPSAVLAARFQGVPRPARVLRARLHTGRAEAAEARAGTPPARPLLIQHDPPPEDRP